MLCLSLDENLLNLHLDDLLDLYYSALQTAITRMGSDPNICYPEEVFREHVKTTMIFGFIMAIMALPFTLAEASEAVKPEDVLDDMNNGIISLHVGEVAAKRLNSIIHYFIKHGLI